MRNCENCAHGSYGLDCNTGIETLYCRENEYEFDVRPNHVCDSHKFIDGYKNDGVLAYDCDGNEVKEFRILRFPFSADIQDWDEEPCVDPRLYCLVTCSNGQTFAVSVYHEFYDEEIRKHEQININADVPMLIKPVSRLACYEVAFSGINNSEWYYDKNRDELRERVEQSLKKQKVMQKSLF